MNSPLGCPSKVEVACLVDKRIEIKNGIVLEKIAKYSPLNRSVQIEPWSPPINMKEGALGDYSASKGKARLHMVVYMCPGMLYLPAL